MSKKHLTFVGTIMLTQLMLALDARPLLAADVILNEYNAVSSGQRLDDGAGKDSFFGTIFGNGGNWFELLVVGDQVDMRGWQLNWTEDEDVAGGGTAAGTLTLSGDPIWSNLRSGTLLTFIETVNGGGEDGVNTSTDISYNPDPLDPNGDWWINVATREEAAKGASALVTTTTNDGNPGDFSVGNSDWTLTIVNASAQVVFGPAGEGIGSDWAGGGINNKEAGSLEGPVAPAGESVTVAMWQAVTPASEFYDDTGSTSFGSPNVDYDPNANPQFTVIQDVSPLRAQVAAPPLGDGDVNMDGMLTDADIDELSAAVRNLSTDLKFDMNLDSAVNDVDRTVWVNQIKRTYLGDANLDGVFGSDDLVDVFQAGHYEDGVPGNSGWATGDWDGDTEFDTSDFVAAFQAGGYELGPRPAVAAVPEPASWLLTLATLPLLAARRRRRSPSSR